ncbi:tetratricopeptide repeat protein 29-like [Littorina saxatilis]|uniref:Tetratricopeptide repeat protein 29 n=1 Tax=Littorina saxatilis TaxID=31220 RepID=A0AAN9B3B0_9CAEN
MAVALPPINSPNEAKMPEWAESGPRGPPSSRLKPMRKGKKKERDFEEKRYQLRRLQRDLSKADTALYRNSFKHNLCVDMLKEGYHLSFKELFNLIHRQQEEREAAGPESLMWTQIMLKDEHEKLDILQTYLTSSEKAQRKGDFQSVYNARYDLACYFQQSNDKWLSDHFFETCLETAASIDSDGGKTKAEGHCNVGLSLEENGDNFEAAEHFEAYYELAINHLQDWVREDVVRGHLSFFTDAAIHLYRIYTSIGLGLERAKEPERSLEYLINAFNKAKESEDHKLEGEAAYRLGLAYEASGNVQTALLHLNNFYEASKHGGDKDGMGRACDAIAKAYARIGCKDQSIEYLKEFVETAESSGMDAELSKACHNLGNIYNSLGKYKEAGEYFNRAYNISRAMNENEAIQVNRVQSGIAQAHAMLNFYSNIVVEGNHSRDFLERTMDWKSIRANIFESRDVRMRKSMQAEPLQGSKEEEPTKSAEETQPLEEQSLENTENGD